MKPNLYTIHNPNSTDNPFEVAGHQFTMRHNSLGEVSLVLIRNTETGVLHVIPGDHEVRYDNVLVYDPNKCPISKVKPCIDQIRLAEQAYLVIAHAPSNKVKVVA